MDQYLLIPGFLFMILHLPSKVISSVYISHYLEN